MGQSVFMQAVIDTLTRQRNNALNEVVNISGALAEEQQKVKMLEQQLAELQAAQTNAQCGGVTSDD